MTNFKFRNIAYNLIVFVLVVSFSNITVFCAELSQNGDKGNTTLYANFPPEFVVTIPDDKYINYRDTSTDIGAVSIVKKRLEQDSFVSVSLSNPEDLTNTLNNNCTIPFTLNKISDNSKFTGCRFYNGSDAVDSYPLRIDITNEAWNNAKSGSYDVTLTFDIEYVA